MPNAHFMYPNTDDSPIFNREVKTVLVVAAHDITRDAVAKMVEQAGYEAITSHDGEDALHVIESHRSSKDPVQLVITDVDMGKVDGVELGSSLRSKGDRTPIIFMSTKLDGPGGYVRAHLEPISPYFLKKPITDIPVFNAMLTGILGKD